MDVTFYGQTLKQPNPPPKEDPTGCWYACAKMIGVYWDGNPKRIGVPELTNEDGTHRLLGDAGNGWSGIGRLALNESLTDNFLQDFASLGEAEATLTKMGPILFFISLPAPASGENMIVEHCGVIVGTTAASVIYHDPYYGPNRDVSLVTLKLARSALGPTRMYARNPAMRPKRRYERWQQTLRS